MTTQSESAPADAALNPQEVDQVSAGKGLTSARAASWVKYGSIGVSIVAFLVMVQALPINQGLQFAITWIEDLGPAAPLAFIALYFVATMAMLPAWPLSVAAGMLFGLFGGTAVVVAGATSGAAGAFVLTRYLARDYVERKIRHYPRFAAVDHAVGEGGWKIVALLRLSPALPFTLQNYFYGLTAIRFWPCILATAVAILPGVFMYVYFGYAGRASLEAAAAGGAAPGGVGQYVLLGVGLAATVAVTVYVTRLAWNAIQHYSDLAPPEETPADAASSAPTQPWRGAALAASVAAVLVVLAACAQIQPNFIMRWFPYDPEANTLGLTQLYNWYGGDFEQVAGSVTQYAAKYAHELADALEAGAEPRVHWLNYDWALNDQENLP